MKLHEIRGYVILDTHTGDVLKTRNGKFMWPKSGHAKNAAHSAGVIRHAAGKWGVAFDEQKRYVCVDAQVIPVEENDGTTR